MPITTWTVKSPPSPPQSDQVVGRWERRHEALPIRYSYPETSTVVPNLEEPNLQRKCDEDSLAAARTMVPTVPQLRWAAFQLKANTARKALEKRVAAQARDRIRSATTGAN
jgi:hypothetical protein